MRRLLSLRKDTGGSVAIEFAVLAPVLVAMLMGVLQIGLAMQNYNALRSVAAEASRYAVVQRQKSATLATSAVETQTRSIAIAAPYGLKTGRLTVACVNATTQRVSGATEMTLTLTYNVPTFLGFIGIGEIPMTYSRPIFVV
jgi:Flp pilus assembly protein TadG